MNVISLGDLRVNEAATGRAKDLKRRTAGMKASKCTIAVRPRLQHVLTKVLVLDDVL